jgi:hypothetical protein
MVYTDREDRRKLSLVADCSRPQRKRHEELPNARLIAAAPDLLAAAENIRDTVESCFVAGGWVSLDAEEMKSIAALANTAIAKARGESDE